MQVEEGKIYISISIGIRVLDPIDINRLRSRSLGVILLVTLLERIANEHMLTDKISQNAEYQACLSA